MKLIARSEVDAAAWDAQAAALGAPFFHSTAWARYTLAGQPNLKPLYFSSEDGSAMALFFREASRNPILRPLTAKLFTHAHPAVGDPAMFSDFLEAVETHARREGVVSLEIGSFATPGNRDTLERMCYELADRYEFRLPLERTDEEMRGAMEVRRRRTIQKAIRNGIGIEKLSPEEGIRELRRLQDFTQARLKRRGANVDFGPKRPIQQDAAFQLAVEGSAHLWGARFEGRIVSASFYPKTRDGLYSALVMHAPEAYELNAYTLLLWTVMRFYRDLGLRYLNLGGVPASAGEESSPDFGLYRYKAGMGGERLACTSGFKILRPISHKGAQKIRALMGR